MMPDIKFPEDNEHTHSSEWARAAHQLAIGMTRLADALHKGAQEAGKSVNFTSCMFDNTTPEQRKKGKRRVR